MINTIFKNHYDYLRNLTAIFRIEGIAFDGLSVYDKKASKQILIAKKTSYIIMFSQLKLSVILSKICKIMKIIIYLTT